MVIVVNGWNRFRMCTSFMEWLGKKPWAKNVVKVPQSEAIVQAQGVRKSVVDVDRHGAAAEAVRGSLAMRVSMAMRGSMAMRILKQQAIFAV